MKRTYKHFFNDGVLTPQVITERWMNRANEIYLAIITESARWGDYRRDVHQRESPFLLYSKADWLTEQHRLLNDYFPERGNMVIGQFMLRNWDPSIDPPVYSNPGDSVDKDFQLALSCTEGDIYYCLNGNDPRLIGGDVTSDAMLYNGVISLITNADINARAKLGDTWSALAEANFIVKGSVEVANEKADCSAQLLVYPNPSKRNFTVDLSAIGASRIEIYNLSGQLLYNTESSNSFQLIDDHNLERGIYIIRVRDRQEITYTQKLIVN